VTKKIRSVELTHGFYKKPFYRNVLCRSKVSFQVLPKRYTSLGQAPGVTLKLWTRLESPASDRHANLLDLFEDYIVNYFITWVHGCNVIKLFTAFIFECSK
jgi:hypothetical protein